MTGLASGLRRAVRSRPFMLLKYARESLLYIANHLLLPRLTGRNVTIGRNLHCLSLLTFQAERPHSSIVAGDDLVTWYRVRLHAWGNGTITIGNCCSLGSDTVIHCRDRVAIGNYVLIAPGVRVWDFEPHSLAMEERMVEIDHTRRTLWPDFSGRARAGAPFVPHFPGKPVVIEDGVWVGADAIILKGSRIGRGAVIGAGAVVAGEIPPFCVAAGNPARVVRELQKDSQCA